ncbi:MAG TPA: NAD(P)-binding domain-containing protein [Bryobacteraceae bacterium]|nr:NAD(P)-binding domain-containing protein [Bryobacteraceae bacterium]
MQLGMIGLGRMGGNMAQRLTQGGHVVIGLNRDLIPVERVEEMGISMAADSAELVAALAPPRTVWIMVPTGKPTQETVRVPRQFAVSR